MASPSSIVPRAASAVALLAIAVWLGGLLALGAVVAPVVFSMVSMPASADAMTTVFRRFDSIAMSCAALLLATEAARAVVRSPFARADHARAFASVMAAAGAVIEGASISPRIAALHAAGVLRGRGAAGLELDRLHGWAERLGMTQVLLLVGLVVLHAMSSPRRPSSSEIAAGSTA